MEGLNKQQLILLVLLVSFVTSIATGIITASLLERAPVAVTQTINRVVERTVETVVPDDITPEERVVTVRETVVVSEEDRVVEAVSKNRNTVARVYNTGSASFQTMGVVTTTDGELAVPFVSSYSRLADYEARFDNGDVVPLTYARDDEDKGIIVFKMESRDNGYAAASFGAESLQLGQTVVSLSGSERNTVVTGRVSDIIPGEQIVTDLNEDALVVGAVLVNLTGDVVAVRNGSGDFVPVTLLFAVSTDTEQTAAAGQAVQ